ncbi:MAG: alpha/beta hydrolase [Gammaproteobacteria bacterium]|nr:alpha/beta hydrolase [Gammaproteobacteria bacterium]
MDKTAVKTYDINFVEGEPGVGLTDEPPIRHGSNSGYQAVNLVYWFGATRIILIGYDMGSFDGRTHFFGDHPEGLQVLSPWKNFIKAFMSINPSEYGIEIINCTTETNLRCFPQMSLKEALSEKSCSAR